MKTRIAINGFGRVGRLALRQLLENDRFEVLAINDLMTYEQMAYLYKYDSAHGTARETTETELAAEQLHIGPHVIALLREQDASRLPWRKLDIDVVLECSGAYKNRAAVQAHLDAGATRVLASRPIGNDVPTVVFGVNESILCPDDTIVSAASCSANCLALLADTLNGFAPILSAFSNTIHSVTPSQMITDDAQCHGDLRRSRSGMVNIIPTTALAAKAIGSIIPQLSGKLDGGAIRVPSLAGSLVLLHAVVRAEALDKDTLNTRMKEHSNELFGYTEELLVSGDVTGLEQGALFDAAETKVLKIDEGLYQVQVAAWFDNECSYVAQMLRVLDEFIGGSPHENVLEQKLHKGVLAAEYE